MNESLDAGAVLAMDPDTLAAYRDLQIERAVQKVMPAPCAHGRIIPQLEAEVRRRLTATLADACPQCRGTGTVRIVGRRERRPCPRCGGSGRLVPA